MKKIIYLILIISCKTENKKNMEILKDSLEFVELQKNVKIKFSQAEKKFDEFHNKNKYSELEKVFYFYKEGFYYFGFKTNPYNDKQNRSLFFMN